MAMRRQRIKATANLSHIKRKVRKEEPPALASAETEASPDEPEPNVLTGMQLLFEDAATGPVEQNADEDVREFKMPAASGGQLDDVFHSDIEDNVIQMDLQKTISGHPMSPSKMPARQRVRPTPVFGQRRNSFVGSPLAADGDLNAFSDYHSPGTPTRRERYYSGSSISSGTPLQQSFQASPLQQSPYKYLPGVMSPGVGRIRTESTCSVYSDSYQPGNTKQRKNDGGDKSQQPQQRVNARRDFETRFNKGVPDKSTFKMFDMIYYNPESNPMDKKPIISAIKAETNAVEDTKPSQEQLVTTKTETPAAMLVPQLKLDANGEMIIDEKTLEIETTAEVEARKVLANSSLILIDETTGNNGFYKRQKRTRGWTSEETVRFYRSLQIIGTDFSLMCEMFPQRTRRDLKLKYKKEERANGQLINKALLYPRTFNLQDLKDQLEKEDLEKAEAERQWKEIVASKPEISTKRAKSQKSKSSRTLSDGDLIYENEHVTLANFTKQAWAKRRKLLEAESSTDENAPTTKRKRKRRNVVTEQQAEPTKLMGTAPAAIKEEAVIKSEQTIGQSKKQLAPQILQQELNSLLNDDDDNDTIDSSNLKTVVNLDDGTVNYVSDVESEIPETEVLPTTTTPPANNDASALLAKPSLTERDIEQVLVELAEGSMVLVSSLDPDDDDRVINEIYMYNKNGELCEQPLDIPDHIVQCIYNVVS